MGLGDLGPDKGDSNHYKQYARHEEQDRIEEIMEEAKSRFPTEPEIDFIEVSPEMTRHHGFYYHREESQYIRVAEEMVEEYPWYYIERVIRHEMVHAWMYQNGYPDFDDNSRIFEWVCGKVGADVTKADIDSEEYEIIRLFEGIDPNE